MSIDVLDAMDQDIDIAPIPKSSGGTDATAHQVNQHIFEDHPEAKLTSSGGPTAVELGQHELGTRGIFSA